MDYVVGSIAALISGNVTPNRPKLIRRALTPTKHPVSPNVTPKSEFVEDRSIFLSPTQQKKKAIVKKSPKRIFENPDLDITENGENSSPKADKVKKHLEEKLEAEVMGKSKKSPSHKLDKSMQSVSPANKTEINDSQIGNESTPKKKKRKFESEVSDNSKVEGMAVDRTTAAIGKKDSKSPKKMRKKSAGDIDPTIDNEIEDKAAEKPIQTMKETANSQDVKKKNKKRKKKNKTLKPAVLGTVENKTEDKNTLIAEENKEEENKTLAKSPKKKKNRKNKNKKAKLAVKESLAKVDQETTANEEKSDKETKELSNKVEQHQSDDEQDDNDDNEDKNDDIDDESDEEISNVANPNAITEKDTDSEHDSDDEIESENEEINEDVLKTEDADDSSDDEDVKTKKGLYFLKYLLASIKQEMIITDGRGWPR